MFHVTYNAVLNTYLHEYEPNEKVLHEYDVNAGKCIPKKGNTVSAMRKSVINAPKNIKGKPHKTQLFKLIKLFPNRNTRSIQQKYSESIQQMYSESIQQKYSESIQQKYSESIQQKY